MCCSAYQELEGHGGNTGGPGNKYECVSWPLQIKSGCDFKGRGDGLGRPAEGQQKGAEHSRRGRKLTGWASKRLKVDPWGLSTEAWQEPQGCLWLWTSKFLDTTQEGSHPSSLSWRSAYSEGSSVPLTLVLYSLQVSLEERSGPFPPLTYL